MKIRPGCMQVLEKRKGVKPKELTDDTDSNDAKEAA